MVTTWVASYVEEAEYVEELAMDITENLNRGLDFDEQALVLKVLCALIDQVLYGLLIEFNWLSPLAVFNLCQLTDDHVDRVLLLAVRARRREVLLLLELFRDLLDLLLGNLELIDVVLEVRRPWCCSDVSVH